MFRLIAKHIIALVILSTSWAAAASPPAYFLGPSNEYQAAFKLYRKGDVDDALTKWTQLADNNDLHSMLALSIMYARGDSIGWDYRRADAWLGRAMATGHEETLFIASYLHLQWNQSNNLDIGWLLASVYRRGHDAFLVRPKNENPAVLQEIRSAFHKNSQGEARSSKLYYLRWVYHLSQQGHLESIYEWSKATSTLGISEKAPQSLRTNLLRGHLPSAEQLFRTAKQQSDAMPDQSTTLMIEACAAKIAADSFGRELLIRGLCADKRIYRKAKSRSKRYSKAINKLKRVYDGQVPIDVLTDVAASS